MSLTEKLDALDRLYAASVNQKLSIDYYHNANDELGKPLYFCGVSIPMVHGEAQKQARANLSEYVALHNAYPELAAELRRLTEEVRRLTQANADLRKERDAAVEEAKRQDGVAKELRKELAAVREVEEAQDRGLASIYATVEKAIGRGGWHSQMEAVEDLAKRYAAAQEDSARIEYLQRRGCVTIEADVQDRFGIDLDSDEYPKHKDLRAAIDAAREGK